MMDHLIIFILLALLAEILGTVGGFGSSLFFVPIASFFLDIHSVLGITAIFHVSSNLTKIAFFRKGFDKKLLLWVGIPAIIFVIIGAYLSKFIQSNILEILLAIFLISTSLTFYIFKNLKVNPNKKNSIFGGVFSGFVAGLIGTGGAIRGITLSSFNLKMEVFIATSAIIDLGIDLSRSGVYYLNGFIHPHDLYLIPPLLGASILGTFLGKKILNHISEEKFKSIVLLLIFLTGIVTLTKIILG
ncbi:MAG: sulfite exporter TauE/SafE family protein [Bacteroidetes bacterium]|nr:sulfite exporter TauE/SafE family protein [Bacteroidota bacterium]